MKIIYTIIKLFILLVFLLLAVSNTQMVSFFYLPGQNIETPLIVVLFAFFLVGTVFGIFALFGRLLALRSENNRLRAEVKRHGRLNEYDAGTPVHPAAQTAPNPPVPAATPAAKEQHGK